MPPDIVRSDGADSRGEDADHVRRQPRHRPGDRAARRARRRQRRAAGEDRPAAPEAARARSTPPPRRSRRPAARRWRSSATSATRRVERAVAETVESSAASTSASTTRARSTSRPTLDDRDEALRPDAGHQRARHFPALEGLHPPPPEAGNAHILTLSPAARPRPEMGRRPPRLHDRQVRDEPLHARAGRGAPRPGDRRQLALAADDHRDRRRPEPARRRRGDGRGRARPRSWPTPPTRSSPGPPRDAPATSSSTTTCSPRRASRTSPSTGGARASFRLTSSSRETFRTDAVGVGPAGAVPGQNLASLEHRLEPTPTAPGRPPPDPPTTREAGRRHENDTSIRTDARAGRGWRCPPDRW